MHKGMQAHHRMKDLPPTPPHGNLISSSTRRCTAAQKGPGGTSGPSHPLTWQAFHCWVYRIDFWRPGGPDSHPLGQNLVSSSSRFSLLFRTLYFPTFFFTKTFPSNFFSLQNIRKLKLHFSLHQYQHPSNSPTRKPFSVWVSTLTVMEGLDITFFRYMSHH